MSALPVIFMALMGLSLLIYVVLDGYDLGVGMLSAAVAEEGDRDRMVASIGPFWDANETWLVLAVGLLLIAFPKAQGVVLTALYVPVVLMLLGLILRGAAFDFRAKGDPAHKRGWDAAFAGGSALASLTQGWMLGRYVTGFEDGAAQCFAAGIAIALTACYALLGASWLLIKTEGELQRRAVGWARRAWPAVVAGLLVVSIASPWLSPTVRARWFELPGLIALAPLPLTALLALATLRGMLNSHRVLGKLSWAPFALMVLVLSLSFFGLSYSLYPFVVIDRITIWDAAAADESLRFLLIGAAVTMPVILAYSLLSYRVFRGKARVLAY